MLAAVGGVFAPGKLHDENDNTGLKSGRTGDDTNTTYGCESEAIATRDISQYTITGPKTIVFFQFQIYKDELEIFLYHWGRIISQFRDDVLPTEELQVIDAIKLEILMNRALRNQQTNMNDIGRYEDMVTLEKEQPFELQDKDAIFNLERQIAILRAAQETITRDYKDLQTKKASMLKDLKATREQRIKRLEDSKQTFIGWIKNLMSNPDIRRQLGQDMEKMRIAMNAEQDRLTEWHQYEDKLSLDVDL